MKIGNASVARAWRAYGIKPWKAESFRFSTDPELVGKVGKVTDICGLYLAPPENAIVLCVDEKSQIQALDQTVPVLPVTAGARRMLKHGWTAIAFGAPFNLQLTRSGVLVPDDFAGAVLRIDRHRRVSVAVLDVVGLAGSPSSVQALGESRSSGTTAA